MMMSEGMSIAKGPRGLGRPGVTLATICSGREFQIKSAAIGITTIDSDLFKCLNQLCGRVRDFDTS